MWEWSANSLWALAVHWNNVSTYHSYTRITSHSSPSNRVGVAVFPGGHTDGQRIVLR